MDIAAVERTKKGIFKRFYTTDVMNERHVCASVESSSIDITDMADQNTNTTEVTNTALTYVCGCCGNHFPAICGLHEHLMKHEAGGSYHYDHLLRTAFPKYDTQCNSTQTVRGKERRFIIRQLKKMGSFILKEETPTVESRSTLRTRTRLAGQEIDSCRDGTNANPDDANMHTCVVKDKDEHIDNAKLKDEDNDKNMYTHKLRSCRVLLDRIPEVKGNNTESDKVQKELPMGIPKVKVRKTCTVNKELLDGKQKIRVRKPESDPVNDMKARDALVRYDIHKQDGVEDDKLKREPEREGMTNTESNPIRNIDVNINKHDSAEDDKKCIKAEPDEEYRTSFEDVADDFDDDVEDEQLFEKEDLLKEESLENNMKTETINNHLSNTVNENNATTIFDIKETINNESYNNKGTNKDDDTHTINVIDLRKRATKTVSYKGKQTASSDSNDEYVIDDDDDDSDWEDRSSNTFRKLKKIKTEKDGYKKTPAALLDNDINCVLDVDNFKDANATKKTVKNTTLKMRAYKKKRSAFWHSDDENWEELERNARKERRKMKRIENDRRNKELGKYKNKIKEKEEKGIEKACSEESKDKEQKPKKKYPVKSIVCYICGVEQKKGKKAYEDHITAVHIGNAVIPCTICDKKFCTQRQLKIHMKWHAEYRSFQCEVCAGQFNSMHTLKIHRFIHTGEYPYTCLHCPKVFRTMGCRLKHTKCVHLKLRPHKCNTCGKAFKSKTHLNRHNLIHTPGSLSCEACGKRFNSSTSLKRHEKIHTGEKPHKCQVCGHGFIQKTPYWIHMEKHHALSKDDVVKILEAKKQEEKPKVNEQLTVLSAN